MATTEQQPITVEQWQARAVELFGSDCMRWRFVCPSCGHVQSVQDYRDAGAPSEAVAFSCVGRWRQKSAEAFGVGDNANGCNYAGGGFIRLNPVPVGESSAFAFDGEDPKDTITKATKGGDHGNE